MSTATLPVMTAPPMTPMAPDEKAFCKAMGERIAAFRKGHGMTQVQLAELMGVAQQVVGSWEVGRSRVPVAILPRLARALAVTVADLIGEEASPSRRGPTPRLLQQVERIQRLPKSQQRFIMQMIDTALQANASAAE
ncbi:MAG: helix-turn-helix domain-containing protein [Alphaproteobacteria bacterium]|nr:helix-turn-helix domain-containing protein [Alphaproteobacteria bacterium]